MKKLLLLIACVAMVVGCETDRVSELSHSQLTLKALETAQLKVNRGNEIRWGSDDGRVAAVDQNGLVKALTVGETQITAKSLDFGTLACKVTVEGKYTLYTEPFKDFGSSKSAIKTKEKRMLSKEDTDALSYIDPVAKEIIYLFKNNKMTGCSGVFSLQSDVEVITGFLKERYAYEGKKSNTWYFSGKDAVVGLSVENYGILIMYIAPTSKAAYSKASLVLESNVNEDGGVVESVKKQIETNLSDAI